MTQGRYAVVIERAAGNYQRTLYTFDTVQAADTNAKMKAAAEGRPLLFHVVDTDTNHCLFTYKAKWWVRPQDIGEDGKIKLWSEQTVDPVTEYFNASKGS